MNKIAKYTWPLWYFWVALWQLGRKWFDRLWMRAWGYAIHRLTRMEVYYIDDGDGYKLDEIFLTFGGVCQFHLESMGDREDFLQWWAGLYASHVKISHRSGVVIDEPTITHRKYAEGETLHLNWCCTKKGNLTSLEE